MTLLTYLITFLLFGTVLTEATKESNCSGYECLKEYVEKTDNVYQWTDTGHRLHGLDPLHVKRWTGYILNVTSQEWLTPNDSSRSVWWHYLVVIVPRKLDYMDTPFFWIASVSSGNMEDPMPSAFHPDLLIAADFAVQAKSLAGVLFHVPNQPIRFPGDPLNESRTENAVLAYTWWHYMHDPQPEPEWVVRFPMAKSCVRGMDAFTAFMTSETAPKDIRELNSQPNQFIVGGASKRGFTTWAVAAVDPRVMGIVPIVMDELNFVKNMHHHFRAYGGWSFALDDFFKMNVTDMLDDPKFQQMQDMVDVYTYREKLLMPKLVISATGDEFFILDNTRWWWQDMPKKDELNKLLVLPNTEHVEITGIFEELPAAVAWAKEILRSNKEMIKNIGKAPSLRTIDDRNRWSLAVAETNRIPRFNWTIEEDTGDITVWAQGPILPKTVTLWHATTCDSTRRDFRLIHGHNQDEPCRCGFPLPESLLGWNVCSNLAVAWASSNVEETIPGSQEWRVHMEPPPNGKWTAFFVDLEYENMESSKRLGWPINLGHFEFTTSVSVVPNTYPYPECYGDSCFGRLV